MAFYQAVLFDDAILLQVREARFVNCARLRIVIAFRAARHVGSFKFLRG